MKCFRPQGTNVKWDSTSFSRWRARICLATSSHSGGSNELFSLLFKTSISGQSLRGISTTFLNTSKPLRWPLTYFVYLSFVPCESVHWHRRVFEFVSFIIRCSLILRSQSSQRRGSTPVGIIKLSWTWFGEEIWKWFTNSFCAQITHTEEMPESMMMKNAVISVFFLRFLQHGKYFKKHVPEKKKVCIRAKPQFFLFGPSQAISAQSDKWPVRKVLKRVCTSVNEKLRIFKSQLWPNYLLEIAAM